MSRQRKKQMSKNTKHTCHRGMSEIMVASCIFWRTQQEENFIQNWKSFKMIAVSAKIRNRFIIIFITNSKHLRKIYYTLDTVLVMILKCTHIHLFKQKYMIHSTKHQWLVFWFNMLSRKVKAVPNSDWNRSKTPISQEVTVCIWKHFGETQE